MKKIMIVAAAVAMTLAGEAAMKATPKPCENCGAGGGGPCPAVVFKVTGSGKAVTVKKDYKEVKSLKIKKGGLALVDTCTDYTYCCYNDGAFFAKITAGKAKFSIASRITPGVWSVFGKKLDELRGGNVKKGKTYKLDSALFISTPIADDCSNANVENYIDGDTAIDPDSVEFYASAFGKMSVKISQKKGSYCGETECDPTYSPKSYSGWFVGKYSCVGPEDCFLCECVDTDVFGGTWKATYKSSASTVRGARSLAGVSVGDDLIADIEADMAEVIIDEGDDDDEETEDDE